MPVKEPIRLGIRGDERFPDQMGLLKRSKSGDILSRGGSPIMTSCSLCGILGLPTCVGLNHGKKNRLWGKARG